MSLPPEKVSELKQIIHSQLTQMDIQSHIREVLSDSLRGGERKPGEDMSEADLLEALRRRGIVESVMDHLQFEGAEQGCGNRKATHFVDKEEHLMTAVPLKKANVDPTRRYLYLQILGGRAFIDHLDEPEALPGQASSVFNIHILFRGQRLRSRPVPCACDPDFHEGFLLEIHNESLGDAASMMDSGGMLGLSQPLHLVLVKTDPEGERTLVSSHHLEWRTVLAASHAKVSLPVELLGTGTENKVPVGVLDMQLEMLPCPSQLLTKEVVNAQLSLEHNRTSERERLFLVYAKQWWREYLAIRPSHNNRLVKIFAQDENGVNRPSCAFVQPLRAGRLINTPRSAGRFVSLLSYQPAAAVGGGGAGSRRERWSSRHGFLAASVGDVEDHTCLLCSLLLGFGLNAFVCIGTKSKGASHAWVVTLATNGIVTFWESLSGHRHIHQTVKPDELPTAYQPGNSPYRTIGSVFNHKSFYANSQPSDCVDLCRFDLHDESLWKAMSQDALMSVCSPRSLTGGWSQLTILTPSPYDSTLVSVNMEQQLRSLVIDHRKGLGLTCVWDEELSYLLSQALAAYELERSTGVSVGNEEFQESIRRAIPDGHTFKAFPIQLIHHNAKRAMATCLRSPVCEDIVSCRGDHVRMVLRVCTFTYPETACAVWIMFACKYKSVL